MKTLKRISKIQSKRKTVLTQMISVGVVALIGLFLIEVPASGFSGSGAGTVADPYQITNATQLQEMKDDLNAHYVLVNDIDCSDTVTWNGGAGFDPVGYDQYHYFRGTFDGRGYLIAALFINRPGATGVGLFGNVQYTTTIKNVGLEDVDITGGEHVGVLIGGTHYVTVSNCYSTGDVSGDNYVGGLLSSAFHSTVSNCYSTANVNASGDYCAGGLAGYGCDGTFINCYSTGDVSGNTYVGGLAGYGSCEDGEIRNCYSTGNVSGDTNVGGLVGYISQYNSVSNSYSTGNVSGDTNVGGLVGKNNGTITNCYYNNHAGNPSVGIGYGFGDCTAIANNESYFYHSSSPPMDVWDFVNIWGIDEGVRYPYLLWQPPIVDTTPPEIIYPTDITVEQESGDGTVVEFECTATDNVDPDPIVICDPPSGSTFPLGTTTVTCLATDASGNSSTCTFTVTVVDTTPPTITSISAGPSVLWPPNHKMVEVTVTVDCEDICDPVPLCCIVGVNSNEPDDGNTEPDWELFDDEPLVALLRAERAGGGNGRVYTISVECIDASDNTATAMVEVTVPHDQGKGKGQK